MKILNLGAGGVRPGPPFVNLDNLLSQFTPDREEHKQLLRESNYVNFDISSGPLPFPDDEFDGISILHVVEHFSAIPAVALLTECRRVLKPGGVIVVSVPDAEYFRVHHLEDTRENAVRIFGEPIHHPTKQSFRSYAVFLNNPPHEVHLQVLGEDALWLLLVEAGFDSDMIERLNEFGDINAHPFDNPPPLPEAEAAILKIINRWKFSLILRATK